VLTQPDALRVRIVAKRLPEYLGYSEQVLEIRTPSWSTCGVKTLGFAPLETVPASIQKRAWALPIGYTPETSLAVKAFSYPGLRDHLPEQVCTTEWPEKGKVWQLTSSELATKRALKTTFFFVGVHVKNPSLFTLK